MIFLRFCHVPYVSIYACSFLKICVYYFFHFLFHWFRKKKSSRVRLSRVSKKAVTLPAMALLSQNQQLHLEKVARKAALLHSSIGFANSSVGDYRPVSQFELERKPSKLSQTLKPPHKVDESLASQYIAKKYPPTQKPVSTNRKVAMNTTNIVLGTDAWDTTLASSAVGDWANFAPEDKIDLLETIDQKRDATLDGAHTASMTETHILPMWNSYQTDEPIRAASFQKYSMLRDAKLRHTRSAYDPDEKYVIPPTEQSSIGWGISDKYGMACSKHNPSCEYHGRQGTHITKFSERMLLGARHHLSGPNAPKTLHY